MSDRPKLAAARREVTGKAVAHLRREGRLPAVVFGHGIDSSNVSVDEHEFAQLRRHAGANMLIDLTVDGSRPTPVLIHGVQHHRVNQRLLHVDLYAVRMTEELIVEVPLVATGSSEAITLHGGTLHHPTEQLKVKALPDHLPQSISYSLDSLLTFEDAIHVRDLVIPGDVTLMTDPDEIVARVLPPRVEEVVAQPEAVAPIAAAGETGAPAAGAPADATRPTT